MRLGPLTELDVSKIKQILSAANSSCEVILSDEHLKVAIEKQNQENKLSRFHRQTSSLTPAHCLFIEVKMEDLLLVKQELEKMGVLLKPENSTEIPAVPEYICRKCRSVQEQPGQCVNHPEIELIEFGQYVIRKSTAPADYKSTMLFVAIAALCGGLIYFGMNW